MFSLIIIAFLAIITHGQHFLPPLEGSPFAIIFNLVDPANIHQRIANATAALPGISMLTSWLRPPETPDTNDLSPADIASIEQLLGLQLGLQSTVKEAPPPPTPLGSAANFALATNEGVINGLGNAVNDVVRGVSGFFGIPH